MQEYRTARHAAHAKLDKMRDLLITGLSDGYYAVDRTDVEGEVDFICVKRPTKGTFNGTLKVMSQHSDQWTVEVTLIIDPEAAKTKWGQPHQEIMRDARWADVLVMLLPNIVEAGMLYAQKTERCAVCSKRLTVERSRFYSIGPECEESHQDIIDWVEARRGEYYQGATLEWA